MLLHSMQQELNNFYPVLTCTQFMAAQIHNFQVLSHLFYFSSQSLCGSLGDASQSTWCSAEHSLGISGLNKPFLKWLVQYDTKGKFSSFCYKDCMSTLSFMFYACFMLNNSAYSVRTINRPTRVVVT